MSKPPVITPETRKAAVEKAIASRQRIAQFKQDLCNGEATFEDAFAMRKDEAIGRMTVRHLLQTLPGVGVARADSIMKEIQIAPSRRLRGLGERQRRELLAIETKFRSMDQGV